MSATAIRGIVFDLFDTLTPPAAQWSELPTTAATLGVANDVWDRALVESSDLDARSIVERSLNIAADICIYTNRNLLIDEIK